MRPIQANEIEWSRPDASRKIVQRWEITRAPTKGRLTVVLLSLDLIGAPTHYVGGRTTPCRPTDCIGCEAGMSPQMKYYIACHEQQTNGHLILEVTGPQADWFEPLHKQYRTLRGCAIRLFRPSMTPNGRVKFEFVRKLEDSPAMPKNPDVQAIMLRTWQVREDSVHAFRMGNVTPPQLHHETEDPLEQTA